MAACEVDVLRGRVEELGRRYVDLVYGAAVRQLGRGGGRGGGGAEDVTQAVFLLVMRKAMTGGLPEERRMAGWLLKVTGFAVKEMRRRERTRVRHELAVAVGRRKGGGDAEPGIAIPGLGEEELGEVRRLLDEALLKLGAMDREVVVRRYLRGEAVAEVAAAVGLSENTAGRRIARALEKLRKILGRRGVVVPAAGVAGVMLAESAKAAPVGLAVSVAGAGSGASAVAISIAKGAAVMIRMAMVKMAVAIGIVLMLGAGLGIVVLRTASAEGPKSVAGAGALGAVATRPVVVATTLPVKVTVKELKAMAAANIAKIHALELTFERVQEYDHAKPQPANMLSTVRYHVIMDMSTLCYVVDREVLVDPSTGEFQGSQTAFDGKTETQYIESANTVTTQETTASRMQPAEIAEPVAAAFLSTQKAGGMGLDDCSLLSLLDHGKVRSMQEKVGDRFCTVVDCEMKGVRYASVWLDLGEGGLPLHVVMYGKKGNTDGYVLKAEKLTDDTGQSIWLPVNYEFFSPVLQDVTGVMKVSVDVDFKKSKLNPQISKKTFELQYPADAQVMAAPKAGGSGGVEKTPPSPPKRPKKPAAKP